jgi:hypothetical protein
VEPRELWERNTRLAEAFCGSDDRVRQAQAVLDEAQADRARTLAAFAVTVGSDTAVANLMGLPEREVRVARRTVGKDDARTVADRLLASVESQMVGMEGELEMDDVPLPHQRPDVLTPQPGSPPLSPPLAQPPAGQPLMTGQQGPTGQQGQAGQAQTGGQPYQTQQAAYGYSTGTGGQFPTGTTQFPTGTAAQSPAATTASFSTSAATQFPTGTAGQFSAGTGGQFSTGTAAPSSSYQAQGTTTQTYQGSQQGTQQASVAEEIVAWSAGMDSVLQWSWQSGLDLQAVAGELGIDLGTLLVRVQTLAAEGRLPTKPAMADTTQFQSGRHRRYDTYSDQAPEDSQIFFASMSPYA